MKCKVKNWCVHQIGLNCAFAHFRNLWGTPKMFTFLGERNKQTNGKTFGVRQRRNEVQFVTLYRRYACFRHFAAKRNRTLLCIMGTRKTFIVFWEKEQTSK